MCIQYLQGYTGMCQQSWLKHGVQAINVYEVLHKMLGHLILSSHVLRSLPPLALFCKWLMATNVHFLMSGITHIQNTMCILNVDKWKGKGLCNNVWLSLMASTSKELKKEKVHIQNLPLHCSHSTLTEDEHQKSKQSLPFNSMCDDQGCPGYDISAGPSGLAARQHHAHLACESAGCRSSWTFEDRSHTGALENWGCEWHGAVA